MPVDRLDLSVRTMNCLRRGGIETVGQIISKGEKGLMALRNFGEKSSQEIEERLKELGLSLTPPPEEEAGEPSEEGQVDET
jgi:DNA-directed RNA polymerase subunit alpha